MGCLRFPIVTRLAFLVCALGLAGLPCGNVRAGVAITEVQVDGQTMPVQEISPDLGPAPKPLRLPSSLKSLQFRFAGYPKPRNPAMALRYKLEGRDNAWHDLPTGARVVMRFSSGHYVGSEEFPLHGQTPGWRGTVKNSDYISIQHQAVVPANAYVMAFAFLTGGMESDLAVIGIDAVRVVVEPSGDRQPRVFDFGIEDNPVLIRSRIPSHPEKWERSGTDIETIDLAKVQTLLRPTRHPILALLDADPKRFAGWTSSPESPVPVGPGDRVTLQWRRAYSIGNSGPGTALYEQLPPGDYRFRVAAFSVKGDQAGGETSLPIEIVAPYYSHWEFWLAVAAVVAGGTAWTGWQIAKWRAQVKIDRIEREQALERERSRIAQNLHDDLGAGLTRVAMLSQLARKEAREQADPSSSNLDQIFEATRAMTRSIDEIVEVRDGGVPMSSSIARKVLQFFRGTPAAHSDSELTPRELEVLDFLAKGLAYKEIATKMAVTQSTVKRHVEHIYHKMHVRSRTEAVVKYLQRGGG